MKKARFHSGIILTAFAMSESPKFHQITKKYYSCTNLEHVSKKGKIGWHRGAQHSLYFYEHGEEVPVCDNGSSTAAVQQQRSSSSSTAEAAAGAVRWRRRRCRPRQHGKPFFAQLSQQHRGPPEGEERPLKKYGKTHHYPA